MSALSCLHGSKQYVACDDESKATPLKKQGQELQSGRTTKGNRKNLPLPVASYIVVLTVQLIFS